MVLKVAETMIWTMLLNLNKIKITIYSQILEKIVILKMCITLKILLNLQITIHLNNNNNNNNNNFKVFLF